MKKLAILGASYLQLPLVMKAKSMQIETHCFAWDNDDAVCKAEADFFYDISVLDKEAILEKCRIIGIDGITTIATDICIPTVCFVAERLALVSNSYESSVFCTNKALMRERFAANGVQSPKFLAVSTFNESDFSAFRFPVIVKPTDRSGSRGVEKVGAIAQLQKAIDRAQAESFEKKCVVEEFVSGDEVSVEAISWEGSHRILAITDKVTTGEPYFVELEHHQPSALPESIQDKIRAATLKALDALEIKFGASHSEFKITPEGEVVCIEIGARMGGDFIGSHLVQNSTGFDFLKAVIDVALNRFEFTNIENDTKYSGVYFLSKEREKLLPYFYADNAFDFEKKVLNAELKSIENSNDRSGYLIYLSDEKVNLA